MMDKLKAVKTWLYARDWRTWIGHGLIGFCMAAITIWVWRGPSAVGIAGWTVLWAFLYREFDDILKWKTKPPEERRPWREAIRDGFFDLWAPLAGAAIASILFA